jgi:hypothetical protein
MTKVKPIHRQGRLWHMNGDLGINYSFGVFFNPFLADLGWYRAVTSVGYSLGLIISSYIFDATDSYRSSFVICTALAAAGPGLDTSLRQPHAPQ